MHGLGRGCREDSVDEKVARGRVCVKGTWALAAGPGEPREGSGLSSSPSRCLDAHGFWFILLTAFVLKTHVCLGAQPGWKGHRHSIAPR